MCTLKTITVTLLFVAFLATNVALVASSDSDSVTIENIAISITPDPILYEPVLYKVPKEFLEKDFSPEYKQRLVLAIHNSIDEYSTGNIDEWDLWAITFKESTWNHTYSSGQLKKSDGGRSVGLCQIQSNWSNNSVLKDYYSGYSITLPVFDRTLLEDNVSCCTAILSMAYD